MNTIASRDHFKPIKIGENLVVNFKHSLVLNYSADVVTDVLQNTNEQIRFSDWSIQKILHSDWLGHG